MIVNFHASERPNMAIVFYDLVTHPVLPGASLEDWVSAYPCWVNATTFKVQLFVLVLQCLIVFFLSW